MRILFICLTIIIAMQVHAQKPESDRHKHGYCDEESKPYCEQIGSFPKPPLVNDNPVVAVGTEVELTYEGGASDGELWEQITYTPVGEVVCPDDYKQLIRVCPAGSIQWLWRCQGACNGVQPKTSSKPVYEPTFSEPGEFHISANAWLYSKPDCCWDGPTEHPDKTKVTAVAIESIDAEEPYVDGAILDAMASVDVELIAIPTPYPIGMDLNQEEVFWEITVGEGTLSDSVGWENTFTQTQGYVGPITIEVRIGSSSTQLNYEASRITATITTVLGRDKFLMGLYDGVEEPLVATVSPIPADYNDENIFWERTQGQAAFISPQEGESSTLMQLNVQSGSAYDTHIIARYAANAPGTPFLTSNHLIRPQNIEIVNSHPIRRDDGTLYFHPGWDITRSPASFPAVLKRDSKALLAGIVTATPALPTGTPITIRSFGMAGAMELDPMELTYSTIGAIISSTLGKNTFVDEVRYYPRASMAFEARFYPETEWFTAGSLETRLYLTWKDPVAGRPIYETLLHRGTIAQQNAGISGGTSPTDELNAQHAAFEALTTRFVTLMDGTGPLNFWGPETTGDMIPDPRNPRLLVPKPYYNTLAALREQGGGTCAAWSEFLEHMFWNQGFTRFRKRTIRIKYPYPYRAGYAQGFFAIKNWDMSSSEWIEPSPDWGIPGQGMANPGEPDQHMAFPQHVIVTASDGKDHVIFDPSFGAKVVAASRPLAVRKYEDTYFQWYVIQPISGGIFSKTLYVPNNTTDPNPIGSEVEIIPP